MTVRQEVVAAAGRAHDPTDTLEQQRQLEVSIDYTLALMDYWLSSAPTSGATTDVTGS